MPTKLEVTFAEIQAEANNQAPRADILTVSPKAHTSFVAATASVMTVDIRTGADYVDLRSTISYVAMAATDILLAPHLLKLLYDTVEFIEVLSFQFNYGHSLVDSMAFTEALAKNIGSVRADIFGFDDAIVVEWTPIRLFTETVAVSDSISIFGDRYYTDAVSPTDVLEVSTSVAYLDEISLLESAAISTERPATDTCSITDAAVLATMQALAETLSMSDNISVLNASIESSKLNHSVLGTYMLNH